MSRRVLVTGGAGFIGSHLARALLDDGWSVDVADDLSSGSDGNVPNGARLHRVDLGERGAVDALPDARYDAIAHVAGQSSGEKSFDDPPRDLDSNARSTVALADWALARGVPRFVHASSMGVYGQVGHAASEESTPTEPVSWYGASKLAAERALAVAEARGLSTCSLRMFSIYGPGQDLREMRQGMVSIFLSFMLQGEPIGVRGSLDRVRDFVFIDDCVEAWRLALEGDARGALNVGTGTGTPIGAMVAELLDVAGAPDHPVTETGETTPGDQTALWADTRRVAERLGWSARTPLREGLGTLLAWARDGA